MKRSDPGTLTNETAIIGPEPGQELDADAVRLVPEDRPGRTEMARVGIKGARESRRERRRLRRALRRQRQKQYRAAWVATTVDAALPASVQERVPAWTRTGRGRVLLAGVAVVALLVWASLFVLITGSLS